jgi:hypothetical protein
MARITLAEVARRFLRHLALTIAVLVAVALLAQWLLPGGAAYAQKAQQDFGDKLRWGTPTGGVSIACSADGKHVYVAGPEGVLVSEDFGKTGTWTLVLKGK